MRFNQYLIVADEPLLFHCGQRQLFPLVRAALATVIKVERLRWVSYGHFEADESGAMNDWLGGKRVRYLATPHVPHCWDAGLLYEEITHTLLCGDLFTQSGQGKAVTEGDIVTPALAIEDRYHSTALTPATAPSIRRLAGLDPGTLGLMHGPVFRGDGAHALHALADGYARRLEAAVDACDNRLMRSD